MADSVEPIATLTVLRRTVCGQKDTLRIKRKAQYIGLVMVGHLSAPCSGGVARIINSDGNIQCFGCCPDRAETVLTEHIALDRDDTVLLMQAMSQSLRELSVERIIVELDKMLASNHPELGLRYLNHLGITDTLAPALNIVPDQFIGQSTEVRLAEWLLLNQPTKYIWEFFLFNLLLRNLRYMKIEIFCC